MSEEVTKSEQEHTVKFDDKLQRENIRMVALQCAAKRLGDQPYSSVKDTLELAKKFEHYIATGE